MYYDDKKKKKKGTIGIVAKSLKENWLIFKEEKIGIIGLALIIFFLIFGLLLPAYEHAMGPEEYNPLVGMDLDLNRNPVTGTFSHPPSKAHPLGTDFKGSDLLAQLMNGSQMAFLVGIVVALSSVAIGTVVGLVSGYYGGSLIDSLLMRISEIILSLPLLPLVIVVAAVLGRLSIWGLVFVLAILLWPNTAKIIRSQTLSLRERPYVESARVAGASGFRIMFRHLAPNVLPLSIVYMTLNVTSAILIEASVSFLGFGDPTRVSWGMMLQWCKTQGHLFKALWWMLPPGGCIGLLCMAFYFVGTAMMPIINPSLRKR